MARKRPELKTGQGQKPRRDRPKHKNVIARQYTAHDMNTHLIAGLDNNLADPFTHRTLQNLITGFFDPNDMEPVIKSRVRYSLKRTGWKPVV